MNKEILDLPTRQLEARLLDIKNFIGLGLSDKQIKDKYLTLELIEMIRYLISEKKI